MNESVILVDETDLPLGQMEKQEAHIQGLLHRAFSVFVFNDAGALLLQRRAITKYHSGGLWTNTCCGHPRPGEDTRIAAQRRLQEEMGLELELTPLFHFVYRAELDQHLTEHEYDHVFVGKTNREPSLNPGEASAHRWISIKMVCEEIERTPELFTAWFKIAFKSPQIELF